MKKTSALQYFMIYSALLLDVAWSIYPMKTLNHQVTKAPRITKDSKGLRNTQFVKLRVFEPSWLRLANFS